MSFRKTSWAAGFAFSAAAIFACSHYLHWNVTHTSSAALLVWLLVIAYAGALFFSQTERRLQRYALAFGLCFAAAQLCGERLETCETLALNWKECLLMMVCVIASAPAAGGLFAGTIRAVKRAETRQPLVTRTVSSRRVFWVSALLMFLCWLPYLAAYYPGLFTYDVSYQYQQYETGQLNTHHPLVHTLMIGGFYDLGWELFGYPVKGILLYSLFQMTLLALTIAASAACLHRCKAPRWLWVPVTVCGALLPFNALLSISTTKDTLFAACVLWLAVLAFEAVREPLRFRQKSWMMSFLAANVLTVLLRNNGFICLAGLAFVGVLMLIQKPELGKRIVVLCLCGMVAGTSVKWGLKTATNAADGPKGEMFSMPAQQLARVYVTSDDPAKEEIAAYLPTAERYSPYIADFVKNTFKAEDISLPAFLKLWAEVGLRHPVIYLEAFAETIRGLWHLDCVSTGQYLETAFHTDEGNWLVEDSKWPWLHDVVSRLYSANEYRSIPVFSAILAPAFWCWMLIWIMAAGLYLRRTAVVAAGCAVFALFLTTLLGPCVMFRYVYPVALCVPFLFGTLLIPEKC